MRIITRYLKPYGVLVVLTLFCLVLATLAELMMPNLMSFVVNDGIIKSDEAVIYRTGGYMIIAAVLSISLHLINSYISSRAVTGMSKDMRSALFSKVQEFSEAETGKFGIASLITRSTTDIIQIQNFVNMFLRMGIMAPIMAVGGAVMAFSKSPKLACILIVMLPALILTVIGISRFALPLTKSMLLKVDRVNLVMREKLTGVRVIRAFGTEDYEEKRFDAANRDLTDTALKINKIMAFMFPIMMIAINLASISVVYLGALEASYGRILVGDIMAVFQYIGQMLGSAMMISMGFVIWPRTSASAGRVADVLGTELSIADGDISAQGIEGGIAFEHVSFKYPDADRASLDDVSFEAPLGKTTAIIGSTGSGKSTLISLLLRFYDPTGGKITLGGMDIRALTLESYRSKLGYVPQRASLFSGTAQENILMGKADATLDEITHAADIAQAAEFIEAREGGYQSYIEQGGANLSGGQKQRMSIARAIVRKPDIYLFDDSFSALDFQTDANLRARLRSITSNSAVIIVAQRVATIMEADSIVVLDNGTVAGVGKHSDLLESCKVYQEIVYSQITPKEAALD